MRRSGVEWRLMLALLAGIASVPTAIAGELSTLSPVGRPQHRRGANSQIRDELMDKIHSMNAARQGIFSEDVSETVAPFFPPGQPIKQTEAVLARQGLGSLRKFKGEQDASAGSMYVANVGMMDGMGSTVYVVIDFDFDGATRATMVVRTVKAFIRSKSM